MILTVTPNPAIDLTYRVASLHAGESHRVAPPAVRAGGKGINVARVIMQSGGAAFALTTAGGGTGLGLTDDLDAARLPYEVVAVTAPTRSSIAIVDDDAGETTIFNETGRPLTSAEWTAVSDAIERLAVPATCLVGSGSLPPGAPDDFYARLVATAAVRGIPSIVDAVGPALLLAAEARATVLKPNLRELAETTGRSDPVEGARELLARGARIVLVSLGADGMLAVRTGSAPVRARLGERLRGNPTGAGDAAVASVASHLAEGETELEQLVRRATAWSAAAVLAPLAGELDPDFRAFEPRVLVER